MARLDKHGVPGSLDKNTPEYDASSYMVNGTQVVGSQQTGIADLATNLGNTATDGTLESIPDTTVSDASQEIGRNQTELQTKIEAVIAVLEAHGLTATA